MRALILLPILFYTSTASLQTTIWPETLEVTASSLKLREAPNLDSKVLALIPQGTSVENLTQYTDDSRPEWDAIDNMNAPWMKIRYNGQTGYAFGAYLKADFYLFYENAIVEYLPKVKNWYGVFKTANGDQLHKVLVYTTLDTLELAGVQPVLHVDAAEESKFIIGTDRELKASITGDFSLRQEIRGGGGDLSIYFGPGETVYLANVHRSIRPIDGYFELIGTGNFALGKNGLEEQDFKIWATQKTNYSDPYAITQDLMPFFKPREHDTRIKWWGDLDGDNKPDVIIGRCSSDEQGCTDYLFLSSKAKTGEVMRAAAAFYWGPGC